MTRKHYNAIARVFKDHRANLETQEELDNLDWLLRDMLPALAVGNARFDRQRFLDAAGYGEEK